MEPGKPGKGCKQITDRFTIVADRSMLSPGRGMNPDKEAQHALPKSHLSPDLFGHRAGPRVDCVQMARQACHNETSARCYSPWHACRSSLWCGQGQRIAGAG